MDKLTIAVSYLVDNVDLAIAEINNQITSIYSFITWQPQILYCIQSKDIEIFNQLVISFEDSYSEVSFLYCGVQGVAKSRNMALCSSLTKYLWFWDIDCLLDKPIDNFSSFLDSENFLLAYIDTPNACVKNKRRILGSYFFNFFLGRFEIFKKFQFSVNAATYNIIVDTKYFTKNQILFDEKLGLGTYFRQSDEVLFLLTFFLFDNNLFRKHVFKSLTISNSLGLSSSHESKGSLLLRSIESKGYVVRAVAGDLLGLFLVPIIAFVFYSKFSSISFFLSLKSVYCGFSKYLK